MNPTVPLFVGLDYSQHKVQVCVLDTQGKVLCNRAVPDSADAIDQVVRRLGVVRGAALEACTGAAVRQCQIAAHQQQGERMAVARTSTPVLT